MTITEHCKDYALFTIDNKEYRIEYTESEILESMSDVEHIIDSGYGIHERHESSYSRPVWDDITETDIKNYILNNLERKIEVVE